ncbi:hypothetical protein JB92DRAFT_2954561 [Gautieria morchelliformis]|nr:hypothetical protein JB92DRAFT_2954561 [Gautieria morchelliformis]
MLYCIVLSPGITIRCHRARLLLLFPFLMYMYSTYGVSNKCFCAAASLGAGGHSNISRSKLLCASGHFGFLLMAHAL